jgi:MFS family permease
MTALNPDPLIVALVQVATSLAMFLFVLPAGALADIIDRRRLLIVIQVASAVITAILSVLVWTGRPPPIILLAFTFLAGSAAAMISPAWQTIVQQLVPRENPPAAVALNSVGSSRKSAVVTVPTSGACSRTWPRKGGSWKHSSRNRGWNICGSTNA